MSHSSTPWVTRGWQHTPNHQSRRPAVNGSPSKHCVLCFNTTLLPRCDQAWELYCPLRPSSKSVTSLHSPAKEPKWRFTGTYEANFRYLFMVFYIYLWPTVLNVINFFTRLIYTYWLIWMFRVFIIKSNFTLTVDIKYLLSNLNITYKYCIYVKYYSVINSLKVIYYIHNNHSAMLPTFISSVLLNVCCLLLLVVCLPKIWAQTD